MKKISRVAIVLALMIAMAFAVIACNNGSSISEIRVSKLPNKTTYAIGDTIDLTGGELTVTYKDDTTGTVALTDKDVKIGDYDFSTEGTKTINVTYKGASTTFNVTVGAAVAQGVSISIAPEDMPRTVFLVNGTFDFGKGGAKLSVTENGTTTKVLFGDPSITTSIALGTSLTQLGDQTVTVTYRGATTTYTIKVCEPLMVEEYETQYYTGMPFNYSRGKVWLTAEDGTRTSVALDGEGVVVTFAKNNVTLDGFDSSEAGTIVVSVTYQTYTTKFSVSVVAGKANGIVRPAKTAYTDRDTELDLTGGYIRMTDMNGNNERQIPLTEPMVSGFDPRKADINNRGTTPLEQTITVTYGSFTDSFKVYITFSDVSTIKYYAAEVAKVNLNNITTPEALTALVPQLKLAAEAASLYSAFQDQTNGEELRAKIDENEVKALGAFIAFVGGNMWCNEFDRLFQDLIVVIPSSGYDSTGGVYPVCETYASTEAALNKLKEAVDYDGKDTSSPYYDLYTYENSLVTVLNDTEFNKVEINTGVTLEDWLTTNVIHFATLDTFLNVYCSGIDFAIELYDTMGTDVTIENMATDNAKKQKVEAVYNKIKAAIDDYFSETGSQHPYRFYSRDAYSILVEWYGGVEDETDPQKNTWDENKSFFDMVYRVALEDMSMSGSDELAYAYYMATMMQLPYEFEKFLTISDNIGSLLNYAYSQYTGYVTYPYYIALKEFNETEFNKLGELLEDDFYMEVYQKIYLLQVTEDGQTYTLSLGDIIFESVYFYDYVFSGASHDNAAVRALVEKYSQLIIDEGDNVDNKYYTIVYAKPTAEQQAQGAKTDSEGYLLDEYNQRVPDHYEYTELYYTTCKEIISGFVALKPYQQYDFLKTIISVDALWLDLTQGQAYSYLASFMATTATHTWAPVGDEDESETFQAFKQVLLAYDAMLCYKYSDYAMGLLDYTINSQEADAVDELQYGNAFISAYEAAKKLLDVKTDIAKAIDEVYAGWWDTLTEEYNAVHGKADTARNYTVESDVTDLFQELQDVAYYVYILGNQTVSQTPYGIVLMEYEAYLESLVKQVEEKINTGSYPQLATAYNYGVYNIFGTTEKPIYVGMQYVIRAARASASLGKSVMTYYRLTAHAMSSEYYVMNKKADLDAFLASIPGYMSRLFEAQLVNSDNPADFVTRLHELADEMFPEQGMDATIKDLLDKFGKLTNEEKAIFYDFCSYFDPFHDAILLFYEDTFGYTYEPTSKTFGCILTAMFQLERAYAQKEYFNSVIKVEDKEDPTVASMLESFEDVYQEAVTTFNAYRNSLTTERAQKFEELFGTYVADYLPKAA